MLALLQAVIWCIRLRTDLQNHSSSSDVWFPFGSAQWKRWWWSTRLAGLVAWLPEHLPAVLPAVTQASARYHSPLLVWAVSTCLAGRSASQKHRVNRTTSKDEAGFSPAFWSLSWDKKHTSDSILPPATLGTLHCIHNHSSEQNLSNVLIYLSLLNTWKRGISFVFFFFSICEIWLE